MTTKIVGRRANPAKPRKDFPLFAHYSGRATDPPKPLASTLPSRRNQLVTRVWFVTPSTQIYELDMVARPESAVLTRELESFYLIARVVNFGHACCGLGNFLPFDKVCF